MQVDGDALASAAWLWSGGRTVHTPRGGRSRVLQGPPLGHASFPDDDFTNDDEFIDESFHDRRDSNDIHIRKRSSSLDCSKSYGRNSIIDIFGALDCANNLISNPITVSSSSRTNNSITSPDRISVERNLPPSGRELKCAKCNALLSSRELLSSHVCVAPIKHLTCPWPYCVYRTFRNDHLKIHVRKHTGERPYRCSYCDYRCNQKSQLNGHIYKKHTNNGAKTNSVQ